MKIRLAPLAAALALLAGWMLWGGPADPDKTFSGAQIAGCFILSAVFFAGVRAWGKLLCRPLRLEGLLEELLVGSASLAWIGQLLGLAGLAGEPWRALWLAFPTAGLVFLATSTRKPFPKPNILGLLAALVLVLKVIAAAKLHGHTDPGVYHVNAPRLWWQGGGIYLPPYSLAAYTASFWESFLLWGNAVFQGKGDSGLIEGLLFGQWAHVVIGFGGTMLVLKRWFGPELPQGSTWLPVVVLAGVASFPLQAMSLIAKSDWGAIFWLMGGFTLLLRSPDSWQKTAVGGACLGIGAVARFTSFFFLAGFVPFLLLAAYPARFRRLSWAAAAAAVAAAPILLRNWIATSNPIFPWMNTLLPSDLIGPSLAAMDEVHAPPFSLERAFLAKKLVMFATQTPLGAAILLWPLAARLGGKMKPESKVTALGTVLGILVGFAWPVGGAFSVRWFGATLILQGALGAVTLAWLAEYAARASRRSWVSPALAFAVALPLAWFSFDWTGWVQAFTDNSPTLAIRDSRESFYGGDAKAWIRMNVDPSVLVVTTFDSDYYLFASHRTSNLALDPRLDREAHGLRNPEDVIALLRKYGAGYLLDTLHFSSVGRHRKFWGYYSAELDRLLLSNAEAIAYFGDLAIVVDLKRLEEMLFQRCTEDAPLPPASFELF